MNRNRQAAYLTTILILVVFITPHNASNEQQSFVEILDNIYGNNLNSQFVREKKAHTSDEDRQPLSSHGRKSFFDSNQPTGSTCQPSSMIIETNKMLDSRASVANGAHYLTIQKVGYGLSTMSEKELHMSCAKQCCENEDGCDTALLSLEPGADGYRCYLFKCNDRCLFVKHKNYVVLQAKSPEQQNNWDSSKSSIITGQNQNKNLCNEKYEFKCRSGKPECVPIYDVCDSIRHCSDNSDEENCQASSPASLFMTPTTTTTTTKSTINANDQSLYNSQVEDYETAKLFEKESSILKHLIELEEAKEADRRKQGGGRTNSKQDQQSDLQPVFKTPEGYLDSFLKPDSNWPVVPKVTTKKPPTGTTKKASTSTKKSKHFFHDDFLSEDEMYGSSSDNKVYFRDSDDNRSPMSGTTMAIVLLILGCALVVSFFTYVLLSTRFFRKKIKWVGNKLPGSAQKNVDVDGDYLINGMYL